MKTIFKYALVVSNFQIIEMPVGAKILCVQNQNNVPCLWAMSERGKRETQSVRVTMHGTGHDISESPDGYVGTYQIDDQTLVFHVFTKVIK